MAGLDHSAGHVFSPMILGRFVLKNILRNKRRTALTVLSIGFSLFLLIVLWAVLNQLLNPPETDTSVRRIAVRRSTSIADTMPVAYGEQIRKLPHVQMVMPFQWFGGYYKEESNIVGSLAADPNMFFDMFSELKTTPDAIEAFRNDRQGAVVGRLLMKQYGWKIGETINIQGNFITANLELHIVGEYTNPDQENGIYFRWDYLNEVMGDPGRIGAFWVLADTKEAVPDVIESVDALFRNTAAETKSETEKAFMLGFVSMMGNVRLVIGAIAIAVVFTMLLVTTSTMATTIRERMREVAILKAIGFTRGKIFGLILGEGMLLAALGWMFAYLFCFALGHVDTNTLTGGWIPKFNPAPRILYGTLATGIGIGLVAGFIPGVQAARLTILQAMRKLE